MHRIDALRRQAISSPRAAKGALFVARRCLQRVQTNQSLDGVLAEVLDGLDESDHASAQREWARLTTDL